MKKFAADELHAVVDEPLTILHAGKYVPIGKEPLRGEQIYDLALDLLGSVEVAALRFQAVGLSASDLHLSAGQRPAVRGHGEIQFLKRMPLTSEQIDSLLDPIMTDRARKEFELTPDTDLGYEVPRLSRFRLNV